MIQEYDDLSFSY